MIKILRFCLLCNFILAIFLVQTAIASHDIPEKRSILILNSYHKEFPWTDEQVTSIRDTLMAELPHLELYVEYMDTKRIYSEPYLQLLHELYRMKYKGVKLDLIVSTDDNALQFLIHYRNEIFGNVPVVFCGVNDYQPDQLRDLEGYTGIIQSLDPLPTIQLIRKLHPDTKMIFVISDGTPSGIGQRKEIQKEVASLNDIEFHYLNGEDLTFQQLLNRIDSLPNDSVILQAVWIRDKTGTYFPADAVGHMISSHSPVPIYGLTDMYLGYGIIGGKLASSRVMGKQAAQMALGIVNGEKSVEDIPILPEGMNPYMFDYHQFSHWKIDRDVLPQESININVPYSVFEQYKIVIYLTGMAFIFLVVLTVLQYVNIRKRQRVEEALRKSERKYRDLINNARDLICTIDLNGNFLSVNRAFIDVLGYDPENLIGKHLLTIVPKEYHDQAVEKMDEKFEGRTEITQHEIEFFAKDGHRVPMEIISRVIRETGKNTEIQAIGRNISERRKAESALRESERRLSTLMGNLPGMAYRCRNDSKWTMVFVSEGCFRLCGYNPEDLIDNMEISYADLIVSGDRKLVWNTIQEAIKEKKPFQLEYRINTASGNEKWVWEQGCGVYDVHGELVALEGFIADISSRVQAENDRRELEKQILQAQKLESLGVLAGGIAHDFNNLLMAILGNTDLAMLELPKDSSVRINLKEIEKASKQAADLCRQMLAYSGRGRFLVERVDLSALVHEMASLLKISISKKAHLMLDFQPDLPRIEADVTQIRQVVMNLITNSSEAIGDHGGTITLRTGLKFCNQDVFQKCYSSEHLVAGEYLYLEVSDTGCGMDPATIEKVFDPFFTTKFAGRGLGMAAVLGIIRGHKGAIYVDSKPGQGTTFRVYFPSSLSIPQKFPTQKESRQPWHGSGKILVVDDEKSVRDVAAKMLVYAGFQAEVAENGEQAVIMLKAEPDDFICVLLDLTMPQMDGEETFKELRKIKPDIPVLLSSGYDEQEVTRRFSGMGLAGFVQKPYQSVRLLAKLRQVLNIEEIESTE